MNEQLDEHTATCLYLETRLPTHTVGTNTRSGMEVMFTLILENA